MALSAAEEAQARELIAQQAALLSLAGNEATITSKLGATKVNVGQLPVASALADADLLLTRQGTNDKSLTAALLAQYCSEEFLAGITTPPQFDNDTSLATTAFVRSEILGQGNAVYDAIFGKSLATSGYQKLPSGLIIQWGAQTNSSLGSGTINYPIAFTTAACALTATATRVSPGHTIKVSQTGNSGFTWEALDLAGFDTAAFTWIAIGF